MTEQQELLAAIAALVTAVITMAGYIVAMNNKHSKEKDALLRMVVEAAMKMTYSLDQNTKTLDRFADKKK